MDKNKQINNVQPSLSLIESLASWIIKRNIHYIVIVLVMNVFVFIFSGEGKGVDFFGVVIPPISPQVTLPLGNISGFILGALIRERQQVVDFLFPKASDKTEKEQVKDQKTDATE